VATLKQAERARDEQAEKLRLVGAHAIEVGTVVRRGQKTYAVIAYFEQAPRPAPAVEITIGARKVKVPLVVKIAPPFGPG
jgi:hypothetical protein